jgi:hypothetical protein
MLTKEQVKFFIETMTDDMHNTIQHKLAETLLSKFDECESLQANPLHVIPDEIDSAPDYVKVLTKEGAYIYGWNECRTAAQPVSVSEPKIYAWAIEHKVGEPVVVFSKPNINSWAFKDAVIKELYEVPAQGSA